MQFPHSFFWDFSINFYQLDTVEEACLLLQDNHKLNVNLILFCYWLATKKQQPLNLEQWQQVISIALPWEEIIKPLRQSRKLIKHSTIAWPAEFKRATGNNITEIELNTERMQQLAIDSFFQELQTEESSEDTQLIIEKNIEQYLKATNYNISISNIREELDKLMIAYTEYQTNNKTIAL